MTSIGQRSSGEIAVPEPSSRPPGRARIALPAIIGIESWERFSFYGMQAIMAYYLYGAVTDGGIHVGTMTAGPENPGRGVRTQRVFVRSDAAPQQVDANVDCSDGSALDVDCAKAFKARATAPRAPSDR